MATYAIEDTTLTAIANAIREKGGTNAAMTPAEMAALIDAIEAGGGVPEGLTAVTAGSFTPTSNTTSYSVKHGLGTTPTFAIVMVKSASSSEAAQYIGQIAAGSPISNGMYYYRLANSTGNASSALGGTKLSSSAITLLLSSSYPLLAGKVYRWCVGRFA